MRTRRERERKKNIKSATKKMSSIINDKRYGVVQWISKEEAPSYKPKFNTISLLGFFHNDQKNAKLNPNDLVIGHEYKAYFWENNETEPPTTQKFKVKLLFIGEWTW